jgi:prepilin-type N-terminal cleavage/methylation domain-containing protein/prepilin-type processing-associated H-X9-DG protein
MKRAGFTLVELLVVISILAVLMVLLFPVLRMARDSARTVACSSQIKQLAFSLHLYDEVNGALPRGLDTGIKDPPPGGFPGDLLGDFAGWWWFDFTGVVNRASNPTADLLRCPARHISDPFLDSNILVGNYGVNRALCVGNGPLTHYTREFPDRLISIASIRRPVKTLLLVDSGYSLICWLHAAEEPLIKPDFHNENAAYVPGLEVNQTKGLDAARREDAVHGRHPGKKVNVGFVDGHIERVKARDLLVEKTEQDEWDHTPLWTP